MNILVHPKKQKKKSKEVPGKVRKEREKKKGVSIAASKLTLPSSLEIISIGLPKKLGSRNRKRGTAVDTHMQGENSHHP